MFRSLSLSSLRFSMSKDILTSKGSSNLWAGLLEATFPESLPVRMSPLCLFEWDYLPGLFEKRRPLQRMLRPFQGGGFVSRPRLINPALLSFSFIFAPLLLVQLLPSRGVFLPGAGGSERRGPIAVPLPSWLGAHPALGWGQDVVLSSPAAPAPTGAGVCGHWVLLLRSLWRRCAATPPWVAAGSHPALAVGGHGPRCRCCTSPLPSAEAPACPLASDLLLHQGLSNGSSSRFWLIWVPFSG